jgi:AraC-like DNA-binding protein
MSWGRNSVVLAIAIANGIVLAILLWQVSGQRGFLRPLAVLVALIALRLTPYAIGFAGAYDQYQWLTFAPFDVSLAFGPLVWMYVLHLARGQWPPAWRWHFAPAALQLAYQLAAFALPLEAKWNWYTTTHRDLIEPIGLACVLVSLIAYVAAGWRQFRSWQRWMDDHLSNRDAYRLGVVRVVLVGTATTVLLAAAFAARSWLVAPTDYFDRLPLMLALALLAYLLGLAGWRQASMEFPIMVPSDRSLFDDGRDNSHPSLLDQSTLADVPMVSDVAATQPVADEPAPLRHGPPSQGGDAIGSSKPGGRPRQDYALLGQEWRERMMTTHWYREPNLTLQEFAAKVGVSPRTASRVLGDGLGLTFNAFVNGLRVEEVRQRLADLTNRRDVLPIALDAGFASKASFNRAFREVTGVSPSTVRAAAIGTADQPPSI